MLQQGSAVNELTEDGVPGHSSGPRLTSEESAAPSSWWKASVLPSWSLHSRFQ